MEAEPADLVICDLHMPGMSGLELMEQIRKRHPRAGLMVASGSDDRRTIIEAMKNGASDFLVKPVQFDSLVSGVQRALEMKRMELEIDHYKKNLEQLVEQRTRQLQAAMRRIELTYDETLEALGAALDLRDTDTAGHSQRVTRYCLEIAQRVGCAPDLLQQIRRGAYLHDIGKIGIPDSILLKEGKHTAEETAFMQSHVRIGYDIVCRIAFLSGAAQIVLTHQEWYDGTGYPQGLVGQEIPLGARIFAVADTLDAMTSDRPYRRALPMAEAREEIRRHAGTQFDPSIVRVFETIPDEVWDAIRFDVSRHHFNPALVPQLQELCALGAGEGKVN
jgi:putative nucleotidyltransferase with HDIG domain